MEDLLRHQVIQLAPLNSQLEDLWLRLRGPSFLTKEIVHGQDTDFRIIETAILIHDDHKDDMGMTVITDVFKNIAPLR